MLLLNTDYQIWQQGLEFNYTAHTRLETMAGAGSSYLDGVFELIFIFVMDYQYQASDFGSTDHTTGEWKINTSPRCILWN